MDNIFYRTYKYILSNRIASIFCLLIIVFSLGFLALKVEFEEDITKLIPTNSKNSNFQKVLKTTNFADKIIVNISRDPDGSLDDLTQYATQFIDSITTKSKVCIKSASSKRP